MPKPNPSPSHPLRVVRLASNGTESDHTFEHVRDISVADNGRMKREYIHRWPGGEERVVLTDRQVDAETSKRKIKPNKVKKHGKPDRAERAARYARDPNEKFRC